MNHPRLPSRFPIGLARRNATNALACLDGAAALQTGIAGPSRLQTAMAGSTALQTGIAGVASYQTAMAGSAALQTAISGTAEHCE